ncbi:MAG: citrate synthase/methylcitrate synthase [Actinomycetia bacterium]|jgi:citrate synthase|nr:citrate synthase/methylcitrate synthase [Actinomycetes bacterium]
MSRPVVTAQPAETVALAAQRMREHKVGSVVVTDHDDRAIGILTERDMIRLAAAGSDASTAKVSEWMTADPDTIGPDVEARAAFASLAERGYRHIPVVDDDGADSAAGRKLVGIVSMRDLMRVAMIQPADAQAHEMPKGLEGVVVADTTVGDVRGLEGFYHYRQYNAVDLAKSRPIEDVWQLMFEGELPTTLAEREAFAAQIRPRRAIPPAVLEVLPAIASAGDVFVPLDALRTAVSQYGAALGFRPSHDIDGETLGDNAMSICAVVPTLICALWRLRRGLEPVAPRDDLAYAANYLYMMQGEVPTPEHAAAVEKYLISTVDHGFNASTFTARVITSTGADLGAAVVGAIGALSGPLHGGAPSRALQMLDEIGTPERAEPWLRAAVERGDRLMGFGHRVYKTDDPRSLMLREVADSLGGDKMELARHIEATAVKVLDELKPGRRLYTNVEFYAGIVMDRCGIPRELFTPTFAASRVIGWCAHILEQAADNRLIRPSAQYVGPPPPEPVPPISG